MQLCQQSAPQMEARNEAQVDDIFRNYGCFCRTFCANLRRRLATCKARKISGDETLWNTLGALANVAGLDCQSFECVEC